MEDAQHPTWRCYIIDRHDKSQTRKSFRKVKRESDWDNLSRMPTKTTWKEAEMKRTWIDKRLPAGKWMWKHMHYSLSIIQQIVGNLSSRWNQSVHVHLTWEVIHQFCGSDQLFLKFRHPNFTWIKLPCNGCKVPNLFWFRQWI